MSQNNEPLFTIQDTFLWALVMTVIWAIAGVIVAVGFVQYGLDINVIGRFIGISAMLGAMFRIPYLKEI